MVEVIEVLGLRAWTGDDGDEKESPWKVPIGSRGGPRARAFWTSES